jgi:hypothetical protein
MAVSQRFARGMLKLRVGKTARALGWRRALSISEPMPIVVSIGSYAGSFLKAVAW